MPSSLYPVGERLFRTLEYIRTEWGMIRGKNRRFEVVDDMLHFFVDYDVFTVDTEDKERMEVLKTNTRARG